MPDLLLWDEKGLRYFEDVTYSPEYYLTNEEISILEKQKYNIARYIESGSMIVELGSGYVDLLTLPCSPTLPYYSLYTWQRDEDVLVNRQCIKGTSAKQRSSLGL